MAASDAIPVPRKNTAYRFSFAIRKPSDSTLITTWAGMDSEVSLDGGAFADCTNEATEIGTSGVGYIDLTAAEMNADTVILKVTVTNTGAVPLVFTFLPESAGDYRVSDSQNVNTNTVTAGAITAAAMATGAIGTATFATGATLPRVALVDTCTTNTDMRGTDNAALASIWTSTVAGRIDVAVSTRLASASYTAPLDAAGTRSAVGLASANLDTQIATLATAANLLIVSDGVGFMTAVLMGAISDAGTSAETYVITFGGATYTVDGSGQDATGNRGTTTRTKT